MRTLSGVLVGLASVLTLTGCGNEVAPSTTAGPAGPSASITSNATPGTRPAPSSTTGAPSGAVLPEETETAPSPPPEPASTEVVEAAPETLDGYRALAAGLTALFEKAEQIQKQSPRANPQSADEVEELLGDAAFPDGVDLVVFAPQDDALTMCLTGPAATFLVLGEHGDGIRQILGRGGCDEVSTIRTLDDGDVVVDISFDIVGDDHPRARYSSRVMKGQNLADEIPELEAFLEVLNRAAAG